MTSVSQHASVLKTTLKSFNDSKLFPYQLQAKFEAQKNSHVKLGSEVLWEKVIQKTEHMTLPVFVKWGIRKFLGLGVRVQRLFMRPFKRTLERSIEMDRVVVGFVGELLQKIGDLERQIHTLTVPPISGHQYSEFEKIYRGDGKSLAKSFEPHLNFLKSQRHWTDQDRVLDVGCGSGDFLEMVKQEFFCQALGIDVNPHVSEILLKKRIPFKQVDCFSFLDSVRNAYSLISAIHVIEHFQKSQVPVFLQVCVKALKQGGYLLLEWPNVSFLSVSGDTFELDPTHVNRPHPLYIRTLLGWYGMEIQYDQDASPHASFKAWEDLPKDSKEYQLAYKVFGSQDKILIAQKVDASRLV